MNAFIATIDGPAQKLTTVLTYCSKKTVEAADPKVGRLVKLLMLNACEQGGYMPETVRSAFRCTTADEREVLLGSEQFVLTTYSQAIASLARLASSLHTDLADGTMKLDRAQMQIHADNPQGFHHMHIYLDAFGRLIRHNRGSSKLETERAMAIANALIAPNLVLPNIAEVIKAAARKGAPQLD